MSTVQQPPRTYNQNHVARKYTPGKRRLSIYWTWSYPWEAKPRCRGNGQSFLDHDRSPQTCSGRHYETPE